MKMNFGISDLILTSPLIVLFLISIVPITIKVLRGNREQHPTAALIQGLCGLFAAAILLSMVCGPGAFAFADALLFDGLTKWMGLIGLLAAGASLILMHDNPATNGEQFSELIFLTLSSVLGMLVLVSANDLLMVFIGLETMSLSLYLMIAMSHEQKLSKEAALKYFVLGGFASAFLLYGISFLFGSIGSTYIGDIVAATPTMIQESRLFLFGVTLLIIGFCFKVSIAPFHAWTPDVYQGAPTPHTAYMATAIKVVSFAAFLRFMKTQALAESENLYDVLQWLAVITMIVGNVAAVIQNNLKRMLAFSSISHSGYLLVGVIAAGNTDNISFAASGVTFYLFGYCVMTFGAFAVVTLLERTENTIIQVDDLAGLGRKHPVMAMCLTFFMLSLAGVPPTLGFFGKFYLFTSAIAEGLLWLAIWGVLNSVISVYYYLRPVVLMYMREGGADLSPQPLNGTRGAILVAALIVLIMGIASGPIFEMFERALA